MSGACDNQLNELGGGIAAALSAVDCVASDVTAEAFGRLFAPGGSLGVALTILLTLFVAFFGISLMLGRSSVSVRSLTPRMITLGLVLTFATSWVAYQSVVWNLAIGTPDWLATVLMGGDQSATRVFAEKLDVVFLAVQEASQGQENIDTFSPAGMMWMGALLLLLGTVGVLVTARIGLALLVALGPIFVVLALFNGTRGLFTGWLKGVVMLALAPLMAVIGGSIMLELAVPVLSSLTQTPGQINAQAAMAFFLVGAVHVALMIMVTKVAATMVTGWQVFGLAADKSERERAPAAAPRQTEFRPSASAAGMAVTSAAAAGSRRIDVSAVATGAPANDGGGSSHTTSRQTKVYATSSGDGQAKSASASQSRTRGIGTRFRDARSAKTPRISEKVS